MYFKVLEKENAGVKRARKEFLAEMADKKNKTESSQSPNSRLGVRRGSYNKSTFKKIRLNSTGSSFSRANSRNSSSISVTKPASTVARQANVLKNDTNQSKGLKRAATHVSSSHTSPASALARKNTRGSSGSVSSGANTPRHYAVSFYDKFDIDNMLIPSEMMHTNYKLDPNLLRPSHVPTPKWRTLVIDGLPENYEEIEDLDDATFAKRHELAELKERYHMVFKRIERQRTNSATGSATSVAATQSGLLKRQELTREAFEREHQIDKMSLMEFKRLVLRLESEHNHQRRRFNSSSLLCNSMPESVLKETLLKGAQKSSLKSDSSNKTMPQLPRRNSNVNSSLSNSKS